MTSLKAPKLLKEIFGDVDYAWELLEAEVRLQTSQVQVVSGEDVSTLLQLYMRGVQKMNTLIDSRESFFKNRVTSLMSRPTVMKVLNKPMTKKSQPAVVQCTSPKKKEKESQLSQQIKSPERKCMDPQKQRRLKENKQKLQLRLAYSAEEASPDALKEMIVKHSQKQTIITGKIEQIVNSHQEKLRRRINERKMKTMTAKSRSDIFVQNEFQMGEQLYMQRDFGSMKKIEQAEKDRIFQKIELAGKGQQKKEGRHTVDIQSRKRSLDVLKRKESEDIEVSLERWKRKKSLDLSKYISVDKNIFRFRNKGKGPDKQQSEKSKKKKQK